MNERVDSKGKRKPGRRRMFISLRLLASLAAAGLVAVTVMVVAWANEQDMRKSLMLEAQVQLLLEARNLAITSSDALLGEYPELTLVPLIKDIMRVRPEIVDVVIINDDGDIQGSPESRAVGDAWKSPVGMNPITSTTPVEAG